MKNGLLKALYFCFFVCLGYWIGTAYGQVPTTRDVLIEWEWDAAAFQAKQIDPNVIHVQVWRTLDGGPSLQLQLDPKLLDKQISYETAEFGKKHCYYVIFYGSGTSGYADSAPSETVCIDVGKQTQLQQIPGATRMKASLP